MSHFDFSSFGYTVDSCPRNESEVLRSATRLRCGVDENGRNQYVCAPNHEKSTLVEFCHNSIIGLYEKGNCIEVYESRNLDQISCKQFKHGCPSNHFFLSDLYKFPACGEINPPERCFSADPSCPNTTELLDKDRSLDNGTLSKGVVAGITIGIICFLILTAIIVLVILLRFRKKAKKDNEEETEDQHKPLLDRKFGEMIVLNANPGSDSRDERRAADKNKRKVEEAKKDEILLHLLGDVDVWKTDIHDEFYKLDDNDVLVLVPFLCCDFGAPNFNDDNWLTILNTIRSKLYEGKELTERDVKKILKKLEFKNFLYADKNCLKITRDAADETLYLFVEYSFVCSDFNMYYISFETTKQYIRSHGYLRKPKEKCVICPDSKIDSILICRIQMDILTHDSMEDKNIHPKLFHLLSIPDRISKQDISERKAFLLNLQETGKAVLFRGIPQGHDQQVKWLPEFWRPDLARSNVGLHPHSDIYIINNRAYIQPGKYVYEDSDRCILYSLLFMKEYTATGKEKAFRALLKKLRNKYFKKIAYPVNATMWNLPQGIIKTQNDLKTFASEDIRHDVMYAFVTECLLEDSDLEFFLLEASCDVISEYCRSWDYKRSEKERCLFIPYRPEKMINAFIDKLQIDIINHPTISDENVHDNVCERLKIPSEILFWDEQARGRYIEYAKRGTQTVHHARGMIVGCAGAGKTTLLKRLLRCSEEDILNVKSTEILDVHEEIFEICADTKSLKATSPRSIFNKGKSAMTLTFFDFGGQCVYYACHQIYLTRRAFYIVVLDASKNLDDKVDSQVCDQNSSLFSEWTYGDYFVFWIKSIHTYCGREEEKTSQPIVLIVATHWEKTKFKSEEEFIESLQLRIPENCNLLQYVKKDSCFFIQFPLTPLTKLEEHIVKLTSRTRWKESIPKDWTLFELKIGNIKYSKKILDLSESPGKDENKMMHEKKDMFRYFHDAGKVLYFNEDGLEKWVIIDVQWFVNIFKKIIADKLHLEGVQAKRSDWYDYYETGCLKRELLTDILRRKENTKITSYYSEKQKFGLQKRDKTVYFMRDGTQGSTKNKIDKSSPYLLISADIILDFMQRLGLVAIGEGHHYVPCMNRRSFNVKILKEICEFTGRTSILVFQFEFLPYFLYFRLVVACLGLDGWKALKNENISGLYKNVALFSYKDYIIVIAVTDTSIQLQVYAQKDVPNVSLQTPETRKIQVSVEDKLKMITTTFHRKVEYFKGFSCRNEEEQSITMDMEGHFIPLKDLKIGYKVSCPIHEIERRHAVNTTELSRYWKVD